jgi:hypothetical protein
MAKSREEVQDIALYHMEKLSRRVGNDRDNRPLTLAEQLAKLESNKFNDPSKMEWYDWLEVLQKKMKENRVHIASKAFEYVSRKYRNQLELMKSKGNYGEAIVFMENHAIEWMNI